MSVPADPTTVAAAPRVVLLDNRPERREVMRYLVENVECQAKVVADADSGAPAVTVVGQQPTDVVVLDIQMAVEQGLTTIAELRRAFPRLGIVVCSFDLDGGTLERAGAEGADICIPKPVRRSELSALLERLTLHSRDPDHVAPPTGPDLTISAGAYPR